MLNWLRLPIQINVHILGILVKLLFFSMWTVVHQRILIIKSILVTGEGPTQELHDTTITA